MTFKLFVLCVKIFIQGGNKLVLVLILSVISATVQRLSWRQDVEHVIAVWVLLLLNYSYPEIGNANF